MINKIIILNIALLTCCGNIAFAQVKQVEKNQTNSTQENNAQLKKQVNVEKDIKKIRLQPIIQEKKAQKPTDTIQTQDSQTEITQDSIVQTNFTRKIHYLKGYDFGYDDSAQTQTPQTRAAPANDEICDAYSLPLDGGCLNNNTNVQSSGDYFGGCIPNGATSVFYSFTPTGSNDMITISMSGFIETDRQLYFMLLEGPCTSPSIISVFCTHTPYSSSGTVEHSFYNLTAGTIYYVMIASQPGVGNQLSTYDICGEESITPPLITGPEQDCYGAIPVCDISYAQEYSYTGIGSSDELNTGATCLYGGETNSVWYVFTPQSTGSFFFEIETLMDYDWALYDLTDIGGCEYISSSTPVLCNYSGTNGNTGTNTTVNNSLPREVGASGSPIMDGMDVTAGNSYALLVNNYSADANGYTITFSGTASIADNPPSSGAYPSMSSASASCTSNSIEVEMSEYIECLSISQGGFTLTNTTTSTDFTSAMTAYYGGDCDESELTTTLIIDHDGSLTTGTYELKVVDPNTITDKCGNLLQIGGTVTFNYLADLSLTASDTGICGGESISLNADGADDVDGITYTLNPGGATNSTDGVFSGLTPSITSTYTVSATYGGCTRTATETVTVEGNIVVSIDPASKTVCDFTEAVILTASTSINGTNCTSCSYTWSTSETTESISVNSAGTFTVTSQTANGCTSFNTAESTITLAGAGAGGNSCDVLYVSPSGGGTGFTKDSPTSLSNAVDEALCTNTTIKMQVGVYDLSNFQYIPSYITIEGGYSSDFLTKSSDMSGGPNSTTIRRSSTYDIDYRDDTTEYTTHCSAFRVDDGAEEFRIQNMRIEMPGSDNVDAHEIGSGLINYGIKLGESCSKYNIVRVYIDAGVGAAPPETP